MARIFVSYKRKREDEDRTDTTDRLAEVRQRLQPGHELCIDEQIEGGAPWEKRLCEWLLYCDAAIVLVSEAAIRSEWCRREWQILHARAMVGSVRLIPVAVDVDRAGLNRVVPAGLDLNETVQLGAWQAVDARGDRAGWLDEVERALSDLPSGPRGTDDLLAVHRAWVRTCFEVLPALPGEPFALREIYQPLRCGVATWKDLREGRVRPYEPHAHEPDALEQVTALLRDERFRDLVVLQGPPGSGKSALCLQLCQRLEGLGFAPVLIRFRHLLLEEGREVEETLSEAIRLGPEGEAQPACPADALDRKRLDLRWKDTQISHTVIVLDGWDEVMLGSATYEAQLQAWLPRISNHFLRRPRQVRLVLTGRPSPDVEASRLSDDARVLTLRPLDDAGVRAMGDALRQRTNWGLTEDIVGRMAGLASTRGDAAGELIALPLLTLLAFRTVAGWGGTLEALLASRSRLYQALVDQTVDHAGKAKEMGTSPEHAVGGAVHQGGGDLRRLLQRTAAMVSLDRGESLSFSELERRLRGEPAWGRWLQRGTGARQLVVNYYFKGGRHDLGCEFVHKSFREYLFAEDLLAGMEELSAEEGSYPAARLGYWEDLRPGTPAWRLSRHLSRLLSPQWLSPEVRDHLFWLVEQAIAARPGRWIRLRDLLADVYGWWAEGVPLRPLGAPGDPTGWAAPLLLDEARWRALGQPTEPPRLITLDAHLGDALLQLTAFVHARLTDAPHHAATRDYQAEVDGRCLFRPGGRRATERGGFFSELVSRIGAAPYRPLGKRASGMWLGPACLREEDLSGEVFRGAYLAGADLTRATLSGSVLDRADLREARLERWQLMRWVTSEYSINWRDTNEIRTRVEVAEASWWRATLPSSLSALSYGAGVATDEYRQAETLPPLGRWEHTGDNYYMSDDEGEQDRVLRSKPETPRYPR